MGVIDPSVSLRVDQLELDGVSPRDTQLGEALAERLGPVLRDHGLGSSIAPVSGEIARALAAREGREPGGRS